MAFRFPCYRELKQKLGEFDALCECIELATRDLIERAGSDSDENRFLGELSQHHGIRVNRLDVAALGPHVARLYVLTVYQCLEDFLLGLRREHPEGARWKMDDQKEDPATKIARSVDLKHTLAFDICQYYRAIRNGTMHPNAREKLPDKDAVSLLKERVAQDEALGTLVAPNPYDAIKFDDFVLFTRCAKLLAEELCDRARPTDEQLSAKVPGELVGKFHQDPQRLANAQSGFLQTTYSLSKEEADKIVSGSLA